MNSNGEMNPLFQNPEEQLAPFEEHDLEDEFYLVEEADLEISVNETYLWLNPKHPLYFPETQSASGSRWEKVDKFSVENWYPFLKKYTFESSFVTLDHDDIQFLMGTSPKTYNSQKLEETFNLILSTFSNKEAFMRMSTRSPKDSPFLFEEAASIMSQDRVYWAENDNKNQQLVSFVASMLKAMKVKDGRKIIDMIAQSPRVFSDLLVLVSSTKPSDCKTQVILREWYDIRPDHEFRIFVSRRQRQESVVTAISPYFHFLYFDQFSHESFNVLNECERMAAVKSFEKFILKTVDPEVAKFLNFSSDQDKDDSAACIREYIIDLALIPIEQYHGLITEENVMNIAEQTYVMVVIELNPFAPAATGCAIFNWATDLPVLWGQGYEYPLVDYRMTPREDLSTVTLLPLGYEHVIEKVLSKRLAEDTSLATQKYGFFTPRPVEDSLDLSARLTP